MADEVWRNIQNRLRFLVQFRFFLQRTPGGSRRFFGILSTDNFDKMSAKCSENEKSVCLRAIIF